MSNYQEFSHYYEQYKEKVYNFFYYRLNNNDQLVEDLTSDTFIKAFENFDNYNNQYKFSTWIYTIARNTLTDHFRKRKVHKSIEDMTDNGEEILDENSTDFALDLDTQVSVEKVKMALEKLPENQRECIILKYLEELDHEEIAAVTGNSETNVRQLISRGMKKLKQLSPIFITILLYFPPKI